MSIQFMDDGIHAPPYAYFPTPATAVIWRNWGIIPVSRLALALDAEENAVRQAAAQLGLDPDQPVEPNWEKRGFLTLIRNNWNLCEYDQILTLLGISGEQLLTILKEDDFMYAKMGGRKPAVQRPRLTPLTSEQRDRALRIAEITAPWRQGNPPAAPEGDAFAESSREKENAPRSPIKENAFDFLEKYGKTTQTDITVHNDRLRLVYSYFAVYGDPLLNEELDPYPEPLLAEYARCGINGIWLQGILYQLTPNPWEPSLSEGWKKRVAALRRLALRARKYGIGTYLYLNEPRPMDDAFFARHPRLRGTGFGAETCFCPSVPEVLDDLETAMERLFTDVPELAGYFSISYSENFTHCASRGPANQKTCPRCADRPPEEIISAVNNRMAKGARRGNPHVKAIVHTWVWSPEWDIKAISLLDQGQEVMSVSEEWMPFSLGGQSGHVVDYAMSIPGPGETAVRRWAKAAGMGLRPVAKVQINGSWEMSAVPFLPVFSLIAEHIEKVKARGIRDFMLTWTVGGCPGPVMDLACRVIDETAPAAAVLEQFLSETYGGLSEIVSRAEKKFCEAFREFPFSVQTLYSGPQTYGPMAPFFIEPTGCKATMVGFPYDDLESWRGPYPEDVFEHQFERLVTGWREGLERLNGGSPPESEPNPAFDELRGMARAAWCHFASALHHIRFVRRRKDGKRDELREIIRCERDTVRQIIRLRRRDSRVGFEASNHYYYSAQDLWEKLINLDECERHYQ